MGNHHTVGVRFVQAGWLTFLGPRPFLRCVSGLMRGGLDGVQAERQARPGEAAMALPASVEVYVQERVWCVRVRSDVVGD